MTRWPHFTAACRRDVDRVLRGGRLTAYRANKEWGVGPTKGSEAYETERLIEGKFRVRHAVLVNSGTAALHAGLVSLGVAGKEVITSPFTFSATASAILLSGATPRFADVDPHTFCLDPKEVKRAITKRTAAILTVHLFGYFGDMDGLEGFDIPIIEDACQAVGSVRGGAYAGTRGIAGAYSFNGSKNLPSGEGGCLVTNDDKIAEKARRFINHGENFGTQEVGVNYRMHELVAVLARHGLRSLDERNRRRMELVAELVRCLERDEAGRAQDASGNRPTFDKAHVHYVTPYVLHPLQDRSAFIAKCAKRGLQVGAGYIQPTLDKYPSFKKYVTHDLPVAHELSEKTLCILSSLTPDRPLSHARWCAKVIREALE